MVVMPTMAEDSVHCVITDIPYAEVNRESGGLRTFDKAAADIITFDISHFVNELVRICSGSFYVFCGQQQLSLIDSYFRANELTTRTIVWEKTNPAPINGDKLWLSGIELCVFARKANATFNGSCRNTVLRYPAGHSKLHPTQKNEDLFTDLILTSSNEGDTIFDPCMGSGTSGIAAVKHRRKFIGVERNAEYFELSKRRIEEAHSFSESLLF